MKIDLDWIKKELDAGRDVELECVDLNEFLTEEFNSKTKYNMRCMRDFNSLVVDVNGAGITMADGFFIDEDELKYFRIKQAPTFDDLIDVAVQAYKDGVIDNLEITKGVSSGAGVRINGNRQFTNSRPMEGINFINSLYTETFVIESEDHIEMVKLKASVRLTNGNEFIVDNATSEFLTPSTSFEKLTILTLKGATVTQKRGK